MGEKLLHRHGKHTSRLPQHNEEMHKEESRTPSVEEIVSFIEENIERDRLTLNNSPVITDTDIDITDYIRARMQAYIEVKAIIRRGKRG